jgi:hypothetical protein
VQIIGLESAHDPTMSEYHSSSKKKTAIACLPKPEFCPAIPRNIWMRLGLDRFIGNLGTKVRILDTTSPRTSAFDLLRTLSFSAS